MSATVQKKAIIIDAPSFFDFERLTQWLKGVYFRRYDTLCEDFSLAKLSEDSREAAFRANLLFSPDFSDEEICDFFGVDERNRYSFLTAISDDFAESPYENGHNEGAYASFEGAFMAELQALQAQVCSLKSHDINIYFIFSRDVLAVTGNDVQTMEMIRDFYVHDDESLMPDVTPVFYDQVDFAQAGDLVITAEDRQDQFAASDVLFVSQDEGALDQMRRFNVWVEHPDASVPADTGDGFDLVAHCKSLALECCREINEFIYDPTGQLIEPVRTSTIFGSVSGNEPVHLDGTVVVVPAWFNNPRREPTV